MAALDERSDDQLLDAWKQADRLAGATLFKRHHQSIARFFLHKVGPSEGADLAQATFVGLLEGIDRYRGAASFRTWLFAIARNVLLKHLRNRSRDAQRFASDEFTLEGVDRSPPSLLAAQQQQRLLLAALRRLPIDTQLMLELHYWESMPVAEIAVVLDLPLSTIKTRMRRGRLRLDEEMIALAESSEQLDSTLRGLEAWALALRHELGA